MPGAGGRGVRVPVGDGAERWLTVPVERVVLAVVRTVTTATRLLDVLELLRTDRRVQIVFTLEPSSAFSAGTAELVAHVGGVLVPWTEAVRLRFDLALSASENGDLHRIDAPLVLLPHGAGHHKYAKDTGAISGYSPARLVRDGEVVPAAIILSHPSQVDELAAVCPEAVPRAVVAGDVCLDRLEAGSRHRERYRAALHTRGRLVVVSSTWGTGSAFGQDVDLVLRLLGALPCDEYRVALVLHPAIWFGHSPYQVRGWLTRALDAGLLLIPPHEGWRAAITAADVVIGDHGSLSLYAAATGVPLILAAFDTDETVPGTPMTALGDVVPRLKPTDPRAQIEAAVTGHDPARSRALAAEVFVTDGVARTRELLYRLIDLPEPEPDPVRPVPDPVAEEHRVRAHRVVTTIVDAETVALQRFPASLDAEETHGRDQHVAVAEDEFDPALTDTAAVVLARHVPGDLAEWARARFPQARIAAAGDRILVRRSGSVFRVTGDLALAASAVCALTARDPDYAGGTITVDLGERRAVVRLDPA